VLSNFGWILPGRLAGMAAPRPGAAQRLAEERIRAVLTLTERPPIDELAAAGIAVRHEPIVDFAAPTAEALERCVAFVRERWARGEAVAVHCHAGVGRTGTVLAACLVAEGARPDDAIAAVRAVRPGSLETPEQEEAVRAFARRLRGEDERLRVALAGWRGRMGQVIGPGLEREQDLELVARVEVGDDLVATCRAARAEVVVDFTTPAVAASNARKILEAGCDGVVGTTGFTEADLDDLDDRARAAGRALLVAPNFALGVVLAQRFAVEAARWFPRVEIVESHHDGKADAPSGTALRTADLLSRARAGGGPGEGLAGARGHDRGGVRVHSLRLPGLLAHQEVVFGGLGEVLTIRHDATSRECYLPGVLLAVRAIGRRTGLLHGLESLLDRAP
jgi:4-hydroxy-tetrahydrodipicolinate reductase